MTIQDSEPSDVGSNPGKEAEIRSTLLGMLKLIAARLAKQLRNRAESQESSRSPRRSEKPRGGNRKEP